MRLSCLQKVALECIFSSWGFNNVLDLNSRCPPVPTHILFSEATLRSLYLVLKIVRLNNSFSFLFVLRCSHCVSRLAVILLFLLYWVLGLQVYVMPLCLAIISVSNEWIFMSKIDHNLMPKPWEFTELYSFLERIVQLFFFFFFKGGRDDLSLHWYVIPQRMRIIL